MKNDLKNTTEEALVTEIRDLRRDFEEYKNSQNYFQLFFLGLIDIDIVGGSLPGSPGYETYILDVFLHYEFAKLHTTSAIPFNLMWGYHNPDVNAFGDLVMPAYNQFDTLPSITVTGSATQDKGSASYYYPTVDNTQEYTKFSWNITRSSGTPVISPQNLKWWSALMFANKSVTLTNRVAGGSGGAVLYERIDLYV